MTATSVVDDERMSQVSFKKIFFVIVFCFCGIALMWYAFVRQLNPVNRVAVHDPFVVQLNDAQLSDKWNKNGDIDVQDDGKFHMVTNIILVSHLIPILRLECNTQVYRCMYPNKHGTPYQQSTV